MQSLSSQVALLVQRYIEAVLVLYVKGSDGMYALNNTCDAFAEYKHSDPNAITSDALTDSPVGELGDLKALHIYTTASRLLFMKARTLLAQMHPWNTFVCMQLFARHLAVTLRLATESSLGNIGDPPVRTLLPSEALVCSHTLLSQALLVVDSVAEFCDMSLVSDTCDSLKRAAFASACESASQHQIYLFLAYVRAALCRAHENIEMCARVVSLRSCMIEMCFYMLAGFVSTAWRCCICLSVLLLRSIFIKICAAPC
jgi:hypothetical protein